MLHIITFHEEKDKSAFDGLDVRIAYEHKYINKIYTVDIDEETADALRKNPLIKSVEKDVELIEDIEESYAIETLKAHEFWDSGYTGKGVKVAVMDGGCQNHEDLNIAGGIKVQYPDEPYMSDTKDHGTHCIGIINMQHNDVGFRGIAPDAKMYVIKLDDDRGGSNTQSAQIEGMSWAIENDIDIISHSISSKSINVAREEVFRQAAEEHGMIICCSSGNTHRGHAYLDETIRYPAKHPFVIGCGATLENDEIRPSSSRGKGLDIVAPGTNIMSTVTSKTSELGNKYGNKSGTSMSTPFIAGMFALYKEKYPHLNRENLIEKVFGEAKYLGDSIVYGVGMIQPPREIKQEYARTSYVRDLEGNEYPLQATITNDYELNGNQTVSFMVLPSKVNSEFISKIAEMWHVVDHDGVEHKIVYAKRKGRGSHNENKVVDETVYSDESFYLHAGQSNRDKRTQKTFIKDETKRLTVEIKAVPLFFDTLDNQRIYERYDEHMTAQKAFNRIFKGTGFVFLMVDSFDAVDWEGFGEGETKLETFKRALERYKAEFRISGNVIYLEKQIGRDTQFMYRHKLNASNIEQEIDADNLWTYAKGYGDYGDGEGGEDWEKAKLKREYTSPLAKVIGKRHAPPVKNGNIRTKKEMDRRLKELVDESLKVSVSADIHDLREQGYPIAQSELGDRVFLIDERINLNDEVRVVTQSITRDWRGKVVNIQITFGNEGISKRYQSNINTTVKDLADIFDGVKQLPYSVLDERVKNATKALRDAQTELDFTNNGILAIDKRNPNLMTILNSAGLGVSRDGGATYENAITGEGINATVITAGVLHGIKIIQEMGDHSIELEDGMLNSYTDGDLSMSFGRYKLDFYNKANDQIGSFGTLRATSDPSKKGLGLTIDQDFFNLGIARQGLVRPILRTQVYGNPSTTLAGPFNDAVDGSSLRLYANRRLVSSDTDFSTDTSAVDQPSIIMEQGQAKNNMYQYFGGQNGRNYATWEVRHRFANNNYNIRLKVDKDGVQTPGNMSAYDFVKPSSREFKQNIKESLDISSLDVINSLKVVEFEYKQDEQEIQTNTAPMKRLGFISEENPGIATEDGKAISDVKLSSHLTRAIQELSKKVEALEVQHGQ